MNLQRLIPCTPRSVILFLGGSLPGSALLHLRQLSNFGMISRLPGSVLHKHAVNVFSSITPTCRSWFSNIRRLCLLYELPHPIHMLESPLSKQGFKRLVKTNVTNYWENLLRNEAAPMSSLAYFKPLSMSLSKPHPLWTTAGSSPAKVSMATIQAQMISGRYRSEALCSNWSNNKLGVCLISTSCADDVEDIPHILHGCPALQPTRDKLMKFTKEYCEELAPIEHITSTFLNSTVTEFCQFLLDCSVLEPVINAVSLYGCDVLTHLFNITRTWIYTLHKERMKRLGRWNPL